MTDTQESSATALDIAHICYLYAGPRPLLRVGLCIYPAEYVARQGYASSVRTLDELCEMTRTADSVGVWRA